MKKSLLVVPMLVLAVILAVSGCAKTDTSPPPQKAPSTSPTQTADAGKTWTLKLHYQVAPTSPLGKFGFDAWAKDVEKATNGRVKFTIYPNDTLFKSQDAVNGVKSRIADAAMFASWWTPGLFDLIGATTMPFMAPNGEVSSRALWALYQKFPEMQAQWKDVKLVAAWTSDPYIFVTTKKQVKILDDFKGMKMRTSGTVQTEMVKLLGCSPMTVPMPDVYENLQKGVIDGLVSPGEAITGFRFYELAKYYTYVPSNCIDQELLFNKNAWNELPPDIQQTIEKLGGENAAIRFGGSAFDRALVEAPGIVKAAGYNMDTYTPPKEEVDRWIATAGTPLWEKWIALMESQGQTKAREIQQEAVRLIKQYSAGKTDTWKELFK